MAMFYFDLHECSQITVDQEGAERADLDEVRVCALKAARELMSAEVSEGRLCLSCHIAVRDAEGGTVLNLPFREALAITGR